MSRPLTPPGWNRQEAELLAQRQADDERLLREFARTHGSRHIEKFRQWLRTVRQDIGARGVIVELFAKPDGELGASYYIEPEPVPHSAPGELPVPQASARPRTQSAANGSTSAMTSLRANTSAGSVAESAELQHHAGTAGT